MVDNKLITKEDIIMDEIKELTEDIVNEDLDEVIDTATDVDLPDSTTDLASDILDNVPSNGETVAGIAIGVAACIGIYEAGKHLVVPLAVKGYNLVRDKYVAFKDKRKKPDEEDIVDVDFEEVDDEEKDSKKSK